MDIVAEESSSSSTAGAVPSLEVGDDMDSNGTIDYSIIEESSQQPNNAAAIPTLFDTNPEATDTPAVPVDVAEFQENDIIHDNISITEEPSLLAIPVTPNLDTTNGTQEIQLSMYDTIAAEENLTSNSTMSPEENQTSHSTTLGNSSSNTPVNNSTTINGTTTGENYTSVNTTITQGVMKNNETTAPAGTEIVDTTTNTTTTTTTTTPVDLVTDTPVPMEKNPWSVIKPFTKENCEEQTVPQNRGIFDGGATCEFIFYRYVSMSETSSITLNCNSIDRASSAVEKEYSIEDLRDWPDACISLLPRCYNIPRGGNEDDNNNIIANGDGGGLTAALVNAIMDLPSIPSAANYLVVDCTGTVTNGIMGGASIVDKAIDKLFKGDNDEEKNSTFSGNDDSSDTNNNGFENHPWKIEEELKNRDDDYSDDFYDEGSDPALFNEQSPGNENNNNPSKTKRKATGGTLSALALVFAAVAVVWIRRRRRNHHSPLSPSYGMDDYGYNVVEMPTQSVYFL